MTMTLFPHAVPTFPETWYFSPVYASYPAQALFVPFGQVPAVAFAPIELSLLVALLLEVVQKMGLLAANATGAKKEIDARIVTMPAAAILCSSIGYT